MSKDIVTVVTVCYNISDGIEKTIQSVLNQTYPNIEYIVIDGGSTDGTVVIIKKYSNRITKWISEPDKGIYDAMNKALKMATGDWIIFMNAGDAFYKNNVILDFIPQIDNDTTIAYGRLLVSYPTFSYLYKDEPKNLDSMKIDSIMPHQATFIKMCYHKKHLFDLNFKSAGDYKFFYDAYFNDRVKFQYISCIVADFDDSEGKSKSLWTAMHHESLYYNGYAYKLKGKIIILKSVMSWLIKKILPATLVAIIQQNSLKSLGFEIIKK